MGAVGAAAQGLQSPRDERNRFEGPAGSPRAVTAVLLETHQEARSEAPSQQLLQEGNYGRPGVCANLVGSHSTMEGKSSHCIL